MNQDREEWLAARYDTSTTVRCRLGHHNMVSDGRGGGTCTYCGETVTEDEL